MIFYFSEASILPSIRSSIYSFLQIIHSAKWLERHSIQSPNQQRQPLRSLMSAFHSGLTGIPSLAGGSPSRLVLAVLLCTAYDANVRELLVDRLPVVVEAGRLEDDASRSNL